MHSQWFEYIYICTYTVHVILVYMLDWSMDWIQTLRQIHSTPKFVVAAQNLWELLVISILWDQPSLVPFYQDARRMPFVNHQQLGCSISTACCQLLNTQCRNIEPSTIDQENKKWILRRLNQVKNWISSLQMFTEKIPRATDIFQYLVLSKIASAPQLRFPCAVMFLSLGLPKLPRRNRLWPRFVLVDHY